ncbi:SapB/AmfS family lanthipeptide [Umezawaea sp. NPDC059074]|uniref:SapB/AmfS family lanthipeptide n=1 Tax=Umezawaea sp. NPDC059074 TaxID=3346716 RepID=UPI0036A7165A
MGFILDMQELETPEAPSNAMASGHGGGGGSTTASSASLLLPCSHSSASLILC